MWAHCLTAAELIKAQLQVDIVFMIVDARNYLDETMKNYRVYDYESLFQAGCGFAPVWPIEKTSGNFGSRLRNLLRSRSLQSAFRKIGSRSKIVQVTLLPGLFVLMIAFRVLRLARTMRRQLHRKFRVKKAIGALFGDPRILSSSRASRSHNALHAVLGYLVLFLRHDLSSARKGLRGVRTTLREVLFDLRKTQTGQLLQQLKSLFLGARGVEKFLRAIQPDLIMLPEDNVETLSTIFVAKGRRLNIPSMVIPFTIPNPLEPARYYHDNLMYHARGAVARRLVHRHPKWRFNHEGRDLLRQPALKASCQEFLGLSSPDPWVLNRGSAVSIALDSDAQRDLYIKLGFPVEQLKVIGDLNGAMFHRVLSHKQRFVEEICSKYGWQSDRPLILCGFPPDQYQGTDTSRFEFPDYDALIESWMGSFSMLSTRANILVRPHPRIPLERLSGFDGPNVKISLQPTAELIPLCDLYVASISATIRWAIACGIPVINYDTYRYRYADYESAAGVIGVEDVGEFRSLMTRFVGDEKFAADLKERQRGVKDYWGQLDDGTGRRLSALVLDAVAGAGRINPNEERQWDLRPAE
ncbi:hypothetical protein IVA88_14925 [Bradyrhizobium sp. 149]|uniref:hypothetical protein n=1 Tax=Bradyrhizobium sp. 149 TaxID=2782624 RepID=UPI001FF724D3|nr:hypothetical protein [Bradyrhizobium sp. 149]MCK1652723.1 hypothetical protein [Bradyrhizobium sp. 149]